MWSAAIFVRFSSVVVWVFEGDFVKGRFRKRRSEGEEGRCEWEAVECENCVQLILLVILFI